MFESKNKPGYIDFRNVERMELDTDSYFLLKGGMGKHAYFGPTKPFSYTINAPKLSVLDIKLSPVVFSMLANTKLPKSLEWLGIDGICFMYIRMQNVNTQELVRVLSLYKDTGDNDLEHDSLINSLLGNPDIAEGIKCLIDRPLSLKEIELLGDTLYIGMLHMYKPITFSNLLALLSRMPNVWFVEAEKIIFTKDSEGKVSMSELEKEIEQYSDLLAETLSYVILGAEKEQNCEDGVWKCIEDFMRAKTDELDKFIVN
ncbi:hypothetical protein H4S06_001872 [Coemansia sp. BCRC 34490]|nr:hypothetical protein H4S06_001872 [Coemansia sp. BCRC 34490]